MVVPEIDYHGQKIVCEMDDTTLLLLDFGNAAFAFVYAAVAGHLWKGGRIIALYGMDASIVGTTFVRTMMGDENLKKPEDHEPHVMGVHATMAESHVFEDMMQLVDWAADGKPSVASVEHARHVIDIIEAGYRAAETGQTQTLRTTFEPLPLDALGAD
jgi:predicted dehydrogenase